MQVTQLWVKFPENFYNINFNIKFDEFYKALGNNIPKYLQYEGDGVQYIFCVNNMLDVNTICSKYEITDYSTCNFITEEEKFTFEYEIIPNYINKSYIYDENNNMINSYYLQKY